MYNAAWPNQRPHGSAGDRNAPASQTAARLLAVHDCGNETRAGADHTMIARTINRDEQWLGLYIPQSREVRARRLSLG